MKPIILAAAFALAVLPITSASAATRSAAGSSTVGTVPAGEDDVPGDFDEDGGPDLLFQNGNTGSLSVWLLADGKPVSSVPVDAPGDASYIAVGSDDFNGDKRTDVVLWKPDTGQIIFWFMDGTRLLSKRAVDLGLAAYEPVSVVDYDRDGNADILVQGIKDGAIYAVLFSGPDVTAKVRIDLPSADADVDWRVAGSGDFDRDGDVDLVLYRQPPAASPNTARTGSVAVALLDRNVGAVKVVTSIGDRNWLIGGVADFTNDGWTDLYWQNVATGQTVLWEMEGLKIRSATPTSGQVPNGFGWRTAGPR